MNVDEIIEIALEIDSEDPIDWGLLNIDEQNSYRLIALSVLEMFSEWNKLDNKDLIVASTITKLIVENFVLNLKLAEFRNQK